MALALCIERGLIDIIPIPWNVPFPVRVQILWSTLSATYCVNPSTTSSVVSFCLLSSDADCLNNLTSSDEILNPRFDRWSTSHFVANDLSMSTLHQKERKQSWILIWSFVLYTDQC